MKKEIKVYEGHDKKGNPVPQIKLQGRWLEEIRFNTGFVMEVTCEPGRMILTVKTTE